MAKQKDWVDQRVEEWRSRYQDAVLRYQRTEWLSDKQKRRLINELNRANRKVDAEVRKYRKAKITSSQLDEYLNSKIGALSP